MKKSNDQTRIALLEQNHITIMEQFKQSQLENKDEHQTILKSQTDFHRETRETLDDMMRKLDIALEKKAGKWVEKVIWGTVIFFLSGLFSYLGVIVIKVIEQ